MVERVAARAGFEVQWEDAQSRTHRVPVETLTALLAALGLPCGTRDEALQSLVTLEAERAARALPPLITTDSHRAIALPAAAISAGNRYRIELESGATIDGHLSAPHGESALLAPVSEPGYHTLYLDDQRVRLAVAPPRCHTVDDACRAHAARNAEIRAGARRYRTVGGAYTYSHEPAAWGIGAQLYGLRRTGDGGIGDFSALAALAVQSAHRGAHALAVSPTHAMFSADPRKYSPYAPSSRLFLNVAYIDPAHVLGQQAAQAALDATQASQQWAALESLPLVDWPDALPLRLKVLRALFEQFCAHERASQRELAHEFETFVARGGEALEDHARFEAIDAIERAQSGGATHWRDWPAAFADPRRTEVDAFAREHRHEVDFHLFLQWLAAKGLADAQRAAREAGMPIGLIADLAVGCDGAGSHAWSYRDDMLNGVTVGAPPDLFNQAGQGWGLTTFSPRAMHTQGFTAFIDMLRAAFAYAGGLRIDHVLGLQRLWLVPEGARPVDGAYLRYPLTDLLRLIALESSRHRAIVIGEDLGTVPAGIRERLERHGVLGMRVLWFERTEEGGGFVPPEQWPRTVLATTSTHDLPTVAGWWRGTDIEWRRRIGQTAPRADGRDPVALAKAERAVDRHALWRAFQRAGLVPRDVGSPPLDQAPVDEALAFVATTHASLAVFPLEDLLGLAEQPNLPGSVDEHPNWRRRLARPIDELFHGGTLTDRLLALERERARTAGRAPVHEPPAKP
ncbi:MAG TPA: 4-alpha-glucanotransferase [Trinickia sp.]|nr:4-alpha-glucanotransferase [Trinickia sp.]